MLNRLLVVIYVIKGLILPSVPDLFHLRIPLILFVPYVIAIPDQIVIHCLVWLLYSVNIFLTDACKPVVITKKIYKTSIISYEIINKLKFNSIVKVMYIFNVLTCL